jgi:hypothetical protein
MNNKIENKNGTLKTHEKRITCVRLDDNEVADLVPEKVFEALKAFYKTRNDSYNAYIAVCENGDDIEVVIKHSILGYKATCIDACVQVCAQYNITGCIESCVSECEKVSKEGAFFALVENYKLLTYEFRVRGIRYRTIWDVESPPLSVRVKIIQ